MVHILAQNPSSDNANFHSSFFILHLRTTLQTPREICGVAGYDVLICFDELAGHAIIDADGGAASGLTIGQHDGAIVLITQS